MSAREKMILFRLDNQLTFQTLQDITGVSKGIISMVEAGEVTHPNIVAKLQKFYDLSDIEAEELLPEVRRKSSPRYDPTHFVSPKDLLVNPVVRY